MLAVLLLILLIFAVGGGIWINPLLFVLLVFVLMGFPYTPYGRRFRRW